MRYVGNVFTGFFCSPLVDYAKMIPSEFEWELHSKLAMLAEEVS